MRNLETARNINEGQAMNAIFDACRANPLRINKGRVSFMLLAQSMSANGTDYQATLRDAEGFVIAIAIVDQYDC